MGVWDYIKNSGEYPDYANWAMDWVGMMPGKRGSRRLLGDHILSQNDLMSAKFPDAVAIGGWPMDDHPPGGFDRADIPPNTNLRTEEVYEIPLRSLYSRNITNLFMAGRNISATIAAFTSTRVMATCAVIGQAVGTAAAQCLERRISPRQLASDQKLVSELRQQLLRDDQTIKNARNEDPLDIARTAKVSASQKSRKHARRYSWMDSLAIIRTKRAMHSSGTAGLLHEFFSQAWIELSWDQPQRIRRVQLTFDTGFQRQLTLSASDSITRTLIRQPQPETVKDYVIEYTDANGARKELKSVQGNHQRLNRHTFSQ